MKRENIVGRANVEDTPALDAYYKELEAKELGALWNVANEIDCGSGATSGRWCARRRSSSPPRRLRGAWSCW
jgi:hypothetical protein